MPRASADICRRRRHTPSAAFAVCQVNTIGSCFCDLTANACDPDCCCDSECTDQDREAFAGCLPESPESPSLTYCVAKSVVHNVNLGSSGSLAVVYKNRPQKDFFSELLCIENDNNPAYGNFFMDPGAGTSEKLTDVLSRTEYASFAASAASGEQAGALASTYGSNDTITAAFDVDGTTVAPKGAALGLPAAAFGGRCAHLELVGFLQDVPSDASMGEYATCQREVARLESACGSDPAFDAAAFISNLRVATTPSASAYINVTVASIVSRDASTGAETAVAGTTIPTPTYNIGTDTCSGVLRALTLTVTHNGNGAITAVSADVTVTDVAADQWDGPGGGNGARWTQYFRAAFAKEGEEADAGAAREKSGNPGYRRGYPVAAGVQASDPAEGSTKAAVSQFVTGLPLPARDGSGLCSPEYTLPLTYGAKTRATCRVEMSLPELRAWCQGDAAAYATARAATDAADCGLSARPSAAFAPNAIDPLPIQLLSGLFGATAHAASGPYAGLRVVVGTWGDSDPSNANDWLEIEVESVEDGRSWDEARRTCNNVPTGLRLEFLTAKVGERTFPQEKVAYARAGFVYDDWTLHGVGALGAQGLWDAEQCPHPLHVHATAAFVPMDQEADANVKPPTPPIFPRLPEDAFYPFLTR